LGCGTALADLTYEWLPCLPLGIARDGGGRTRNREVDASDAIAIFCNEVKGKSALAIARDLGTSYKAAFVLCHKICSVS
jgi:hypothetical protein